MWPWLAKIIGGISMSLFGILALALGILLISGAWVLLQLSGNRLKRSVSLRLYTLTGKDARFFPSNTTSAADRVSEAAWT